MTLADTLFTNAMILAATIILFGMLIVIQSNLISFKFNKKKTIISIIYNIIIKIIEKFPHSFHYLGVLGFWGFNS